MYLNERGRLQSLLFVLYRFTRRSYASRRDPEKNTAYIEGWRIETSVSDSFDFPQHRAILLHGEIFLRHAKPQPLKISFAESQHRPWLTFGSRVSFLPRI